MITIWTQQYASTNRTRHQFPDAEQAFGYMADNLDTGDRAWIDFGAWGEAEILDASALLDPPRYGEALAEPFVIAPCSYGAYDAPGYNQVVEVEWNAQSVPAAKEFTPLWASWCGKGVRAMTGRGSGPNRGWVIAFLWNEDK